MKTELVSVICLAAYTDGETLHTHKPSKLPYQVSPQRFEQLSKRGLVKQVGIEQTANAQEIIEQPKSSKKTARKQPKRKHE